MAERTYRNTIYAAAFTLIAIGAIVLAVFAIRPAGASAATVTRAATPAQQVCAAFATWQRDETSGNLGRLVTASAALGRSWLKADVLELAATVSSPSHKAGKYIPGDRKYVTEDCANL